MHDVVVIALGSPLLVGVYQDAELIEEIITEEKSTEALPGIFASLLKNYDISGLYYARGPGSFMGIKISYLFLKTLSIVRNIPFLATDAFYFNGNRPIKAVGKLCFVKISDTIETQVFEEVPPSTLALPKKLEKKDFDPDTVPYYGIAAVG